MKKIFTLFVIFALLLSCKSVKYSELIKKADEKFYVRNYKSAYHLYSKASKMEVKEIYSKIKKAESFYFGHPIDLVQWAHDSQKIHLFEC